MGVFQPRTFRGRLLSVVATASISAAVHRERSVRLGKYWRRSPLVFSLSVLGQDRSWVRLAGRYLSFSEREEIALTASDSGPRRPCHRAGDQPVTVDGLFVSSAATLARSVERSIESRRNGAEGGSWLPADYQVAFPSACETGRQ